MHNIFFTTSVVPNEIVLSTKKEASFFLNFQMDSVLKNSFTAINVFY